VDEDIEGEPQEEGEEVGDAEAEDEHMEEEEEEAVEEQEEEIEEQEGSLSYRAAAYPPDFFERRSSRKDVYGGKYVADAFERNGFRGPVDDDAWDLLFTHAPMVEALAHRSLPERPEGRERLVNHCGYFTGAGQKCTLHHHVRRILWANRQHNASADPGRWLKTYELANPGDLRRWKEAARKDPQQHWVIKPCSNGASKGIELMQGRAVQQAFLGGQGPWTVAQEYVENPYLGLDGRKFHFRVYTLVTRWAPVGAFVYDEGMVFHGGHEIKGRAPSVDKDIFSGIDTDHVKMLPLAQLWQTLDAANAGASSVASPSAAEVRDRLTKRLRSLFGTSLRQSFGDPRKLQARGFSCFDLFAVDVMLDDHVEPLILEVNMGPSLWMNGPEEYSELQRSIKAPLVEQIAHWAGLRASRAPRTDAEFEAVEDIALRNFTRLL